MIKKIISSITSVVFLVSVFVAVPTYADERRNYEHRSDRQFHQPYQHENRTHRKKKNDWIVPLVGGIILGGIIVGASQSQSTTQVPTPPLPPQQIICHNEWAKDFYGNYALDAYGRPYQVQYCQRQ